jgi:hypothetical protein
MTYNLSLTPARLKRVGVALRNAPIFLLTAAVSVSIETFAWGGILAENTATVEILGFTVRLAYAEVVMSTAFSLAALMLAGAAAAQKADPRPEQQKRAWASQALAIAVLVAPIYYAGNCIALQNQVSAWREYSGSDQHRADLRDSEDMMLDSMMRREAANRLGKAQRPERADFDFLATAWIALLLGCNMLAVRLGYRAKPETPAEAKARQKAEAVRKARVTRERNKQRDETNVTEFRRAK